MFLVRHGAGKVQEECGELIQALAKYEVHGPENTTPGTTRTNKAHVEDEMGDVLAAIQYAVERMGLDQKRIAARLEKKYTVYDRYGRSAFEGEK